MHDLATSSGADTQCKQISICILSRAAFNAHARPCRHLGYCHQMVNYHGNGRLNDSSSGRQAIAPASLCKRFPAIGSVFHLGEAARLDVNPSPLMFLLVSHLSYTSCDVGGTSQNPELITSAFWARVGTH